MSVPLPAHMDKPRFLAWVQRQEEPYELVDSRVVTKARSSRAHAMIVGNLFATLHGRLDPQQWAVLMHFGLDAGPQTLRYPDVVVDRAGGTLGDFTARAPVLLAEVLSPSTNQIDLGDKAAEYLRLPSLVAYLILAQDEVKAWAYIRGSDQFPAPQVVAGVNETIRIPSLGVDLSLADIYAGIEFD